jgi:hypothetical protein
MIQVSTEELTRRNGKAFETTELGQALKRLPRVDPVGPWVAGGSVRRTLLGEKLEGTDFDFFFRNEKQYKEFHEDMVENDFSFVRSENEHNTTYTVPSGGYQELIRGDEGEEYSVKVWKPELKVQAISIRYYASLAEVLDNFDFTITQFGFDGDKFVMSDFALYDAARKRLVPHKITYAASSVRRLLKYADQGYTVCQGCIGELLDQVAANPRIIEAQIQYID